MRVLAAVMFVGAMLAVASLSSAQPPEGGKGGGKGGKGGAGMKGGFGPSIGQIMPTFIQDQLKLTDAQKKDLEAMQKDVDTKIEKMLTDEQKKTYKQMKDRGPGGPGGPGGGRGGFGGPGGGPGGPGGPGGNPPPKKD